MNRIKSFILYLLEFGMVFGIKSRIFIRWKKYSAFHHVIKKRLEKSVSNALNKYQKIEGCIRENSHIAEKTIWVLWWQGLDCAPEIIRSCYKSIVKNSGSYNVKLITKKNYQEYVKLPQIIVEKFNSGNISITHLSDIIRMHLLRDYGGMWLDAASFVSAEIPKECCESIFYTRKNNVRNTMVPEGRWAICLLATQYTNMILFEFMCEAYEEYFKKHNRVIDYFLTDYLIALICDKNHAVMNIINNVPKNNENAKVLSKLLNDIFEDAQWKRISRNTWLHTLSRKKQYIDMSGGKITYYGKLIKLNKNKRSEQG